MLLLKTVENTVFQRFAGVKNSCDTILILKIRKSRFERELLNLGKLFRKPFIVLWEAFVKIVGDKLEVVELNQKVWRYSMCGITTNL